MSDNFEDHRLIMLNRETDMLNVLNRYWAALGNHQKIKIALDLNKQIDGLSYELLRLPITEVLNRPAHKYIFDQNLLPKRLQAQVERMGEAMGWNPATVMFAKLAGVAMAASGVYQVSVRLGWMEQLVLYVMIVADSGSGKSRLINMVKKPMNTVMDEKRARHDQTAGRQAFIAKEQMTTINKTRQGERNKLIKEMLGKEGRCDYNQLIQVTAEGAAEAHSALEQVERTRPNSRPVFFLSDGTSKGIQAALIHNHEYQAICEPEGGLPLKMVHDKGFDLDLLLKSYDGEEHQYVASNGTAYLKHPRLNILYGVQPGVAAKFFGCDRLNERGLTARFLPIFPWFQSRQDIDEAILNEDDHIIQHILATCYDLNRDGIVRVMRLDEEAEYRIAEFERELENWIANGFEHISSFLRKLRGTACRLAAALHLWVNYQNPEDAPISVQTMSCGIELARYLIPHADYAYNPRGLQAHATAIRLLDWIKQSPKTHFELRAALQDTGFKKPQALPALDVLEMHNVIRQIVTPGNAIICVVNPKLYSPVSYNIAAQQPQYRPDGPMDERWGYRSLDDRDYIF